MADETLVGALCARHQIPEAEYYRWRETSIAGAADALAGEESDSTQ